MSHSLRTRSLTILALLLVARLYFGWFYHYGFEFGDTGNYALVSYEFSQGATPADIVIGYGPLWYFLGAAIFHFTSLGYEGILVLLYAIAFLVAVLTYLAVYECTGRQWLAALTGLICIAI